MKRNKFSGFTLIELLVVITIIGILAVGGVSVYTSQMAKARDSNRVKGIKVLQTAVESMNSDLGRYPSVGVANEMVAVNLLKYTNTKVVDPKSGSICGSSICDYSYNSGTTSVTGDSYELSSGFENSSDSNLTKDVTSGTYKDDNRFEVGAGNVNSSCSGAATDAFSACHTGSGYTIK